MKTRTRGQACSWSRIIMRTSSFLRILKTHLMAGAITQYLPFCMSLTHSLFWCISPFPASPSFYGHYIVSKVWSHIVYLELMIGLGFVCNDIHFSLLHSRKMNTWASPKGHERACSGGFGGSRAPEPPILWSIPCSEMGPSLGDLMALKPPEPLNGDVGFCDEGQKPLAGTTSLALYQESLTTPSEIFFLPTTIIPPAAPSLYPICTAISIHFPIM